MKLLKNDYEVEEGHGGDRHPYLKEKNIATYLIVQDENRLSKVGMRISPLLMVGEFLRLTSCLR